MTSSRFRSVQVLYFVVWAAGVVMFLLNATAWLLESFDYDDIDRPRPVTTPTAMVPIAALEGAWDDSISRS